MSHPDELPTPKTPEELRALAERKAAFLAEAARLKETPDMDSTTPDSLRPANFAGLAQRILASRPPPTAAEYVSNEELHRREQIHRRFEHLTGGDRGNRSRIAGVTPAVIRLVCESIGNAPVIGDHKGTVLAAKRAEQFLADKRLATLVLSGLPGLGKSTAAAWLFAEERYGEWVSAGDIRNDAEWHQRRKGLHDGYLVYVDDLGCESTPYATAELATLIERRHDAGKRTVITTNLLMHSDDREKVPADKRGSFPVGHSINERYGERVASRLSDDRTLVAWMGGYDLRKARKA
ncbi:MAG: IstB-like binding protein [Pseudomonadota bacterium]|jgi:hypothetical protein